MISQYFYFVTASLLLTAIAGLPKINQLLTNKNWQQLSRFPLFGRM
jgi:hypothetical protein